MRSPAADTGKFSGHVFYYNRDRKNREGYYMKGYYTGSGYCGYVDGRYVLFSSESDYYDSMESEEEAA